MLVAKTFFCRNRCLVLSSEDKGRGKTTFLSCKKCRSDEIISCSHIYPEDLSILFCPETNN